MKLSEYIDHTILKPETGREQIVRVCREAKEYKFKSVCVNPCHAALVKEELSGSPVLTCVVVGFPLGASNPTVKAFETKTAIMDGADEIDMVINIGALKNGSLSAVEDDIRAVAGVAKGRALVKVIIECCLLTNDEKIAACECILRAGADYVKTSTGFSSGGATAADVALLRWVVGENAGVKASGGIRDLQTALTMIEAGASRIGSSSGLEIMKEAADLTKYFQ
jgi:deoxyribose-phosphate aldolase